MSRTYVVTGSASGIGQATRKLLQDRGDKVIGVDIKSADVQVDLSSRAGRAQMVSEVNDLSDGEIDGVLAVAGLSAPNSLTARVNYFGTVATLTGLRPLLAKSSAPRAVAVSSYMLTAPGNADLNAAFRANDEDRAVEVADSIAGDGLGGPIYSAAKWALASWVRQVAPTPEWAGEGIALNAIAPGLISTPMIADTIGSADALNAALEVVPMPLNGPADPVVVARLLAWLAGTENSHLCGQVIFVDGGAEASKRGDSILTLNPDS